MSKKRQEYERTYSYRELVKKYPLDTEGLWKVLGEDPNCDFGGHHHQPELGIFDGKLDDIINYAVSLNSFWSWGAGGNIMLVSVPPKITPLSIAELERQLADAKRVELERQLAKAQRLVEELEQKLKQQSP